MTNGNANFIGIEAENTGRANDFPWPERQLEAYRRGVAAILRHIGRDAGSCAGHKEYARPVGRKPDPGFDMVAFRDSVAAILNGTAPAPVLIPAVEPVAPPGAAGGRPTLRRGASGELVKLIQQSRESEDLEERAAVFAKIQRFVMENALSAPLAFQYELDALAAKVKNYKPNLLGKPKYNDISLG